MTTPVKRGIHYPLSVNNGDLVLAEDADTTFDRIIACLSTRPGELIMHPRDGTPDYVLDSISNASLIPSRIEVILTEQIVDPDAFTVSGLYDESGELQIEVNYKLSQIAQPPIQFTLKS